MQRQKEGGGGTVDAKKNGEDVGRNEMQYKSNISHLPLSKSSSSLDSALDGTFVSSCVFL
jgi:hypothetical protein